MTETFEQVRKDNDYYQAKLQEYAEFLDAPDPREAYDERDRYVVVVDNKRPISSYVIVAIIAIAIIYLIVHLIIASF